jgi:hypothetical protein
MRFKYLGEPTRTGLALGPSLAFVFHNQDGTKTELRAPNQRTGFAIGKDIGVDVTDDRVIRHMQADPRFEEI